MPQTQTGHRAIKALFKDAQNALDEQQQLDAAPDPNLPRPDPDDSSRSIKAGKWDGYPSDCMPPHCPIEVVGRDTDGTVYVVTATDHLRPVTKFDNTSLCDLFAPMINEAKWAWPAWGKAVKTVDEATGDEKTFVPVKRLEHQTCAEAIIQEAARLPDFDPKKQHRGRGGWELDDGKFIWHSGRYLWTVQKGKLMRVRPRMHGGHLYTRMSHTFEPWAQPVEAHESPAQRILDYLRSWSWSRPYIDPVLVLGWLVTSLMGGALKARPVVFTTGGAGVGKSTLHELIKGVLSNALFATVDTTAAGIYQHVKQDSLPVLVDEIEAKAGSNKAQSVIELARVAYTGGEVARGGQDHDGTTFTMRSSFFMSAINPPPMMPQDVTRTALLNLEPLAEHVSAKPADMEIHDNDGRMLLRQIMDGWDEFKELMQDYWEALHAHELDSRAIDTYGTLMAAAQLVVGKEGLERAGLDVSDVKRLGEIVASATAVQRSQELQNWHRCLNRLMQSQIDKYVGGDRDTVGTCLDNLRADEWDLKSTRSRLYGMNCSVGQKKQIGGQYLLAIPKEGPQLEKIYQDSPWFGGGWWNALQQAPADIVIRGQGNVQKTKIAGTTLTCLLVDLDKFEEYVKGLD